MKTKHTPGPWHLEKYSGKHEYDFVWDVSNKIVCQLFSKSEDYFTNYKANAKLIAAAPDLLEALQNIENDDNRIPARIWEMRNQAIKKATE